MLTRNQKIVIGVAVTIVLVIVASVLLGYFLIKPSSHPGPTQILNKNNGNVFLREKKNQSEVYVVESHNALPAKASQKTDFDKNPWFRKAKRLHKPWVALVTPSMNVLVVPTKPFASIKDFAERCTMDEWRQMWVSVMDVRYKLQSQFKTKFYISTIGFHVPQLHIRLVPENHQSNIDPEWVYSLL